MKYEVYTNFENPIYTELSKISAINSIHQELEENYKEAVKFKEMGFNEQSQRYLGVNAGIRRCLACMGISVKGPRSIESETVVK
ncbi:hypothetical protein ACWE42_16675 [Sutcliffiella cohnii]